MEPRSDDIEFVVVSCLACGPVPVPISRFEIHADADNHVALYAFVCPRCRETGTGGCRQMIAHLAAVGVPRRELRSLAAAAITEAEVAAFRHWLDTDPAWSDDLL